MVLDGPTCIIRKTCFENDSNLTSHKNIFCIQNGDNPLKKEKARRQQ